MSRILLRSGSWNDTLDQLRRLRIQPSAICRGKRFFMRSMDFPTRMNSLSYGPFRVSFPTLRMISWISRFWLPLWSPEIPIPKRIFSGPSISRTGRNFPERTTAAGSNMSDRKKSRTTKMQFRSYREPLGSLLRSAIKCTFPGWNLSANTKRKAYYEKRKTNSQH